MSIFFCSKVVTVVDNELSRLDYLVSDARKRATPPRGD